ncbi:SRPBCC family protein [Parvularcula lutaonensis]|uniref:SRPBCC family protein n=1 Tax=Parvularcula lutaonensis TaxID=491923 RepID=A0ABV7MBH5_9PROT|nr:SRPBCC family protein [Parvularcula lutaonensis]GGY40017.1 ATPase [Parvularcula lutaonensis]
MSTDVQLEEDQLEIRRRLPALPERVWEYLTDPALRKRWFCAGETGNEVGGTVVFDFDHSRISASPPPKTVGCGDPITFEGTITAYDPPRLLAFSWPEESGASTHVTITLTPDGDGTVLHLLHTRLVRDEHRWGAAAGWHAHLDLLVDLVSGCEARDFWVHYAPLEEMYWKRVGG